MNENYLRGVYNGLEKTTQVDDAALKNALNNRMVNEMKGVYKVLREMNRINKHQCPIHLSRDATRAVIELMRQKGFDRPVSKEIIGYWETLNDIYDGVILIDSPEETLKEELTEEEYDKLMEVMDPNVDQGVYKYDDYYISTIRTCIVDNDNTLLDAIPISVEELDNDVYEIIMQCFDDRRVYLEGTIESCFDELEWYCNGSKEECYKAFCAAINWYFNVEEARTIKAESLLKPTPDNNTDYKQKFISILYPEVEL